jgi:hypothetical protein
MGSSRFKYRSRLYRKAVLAVIFPAVLLISFPPAVAQYAKKRHISKGPRAVGLIELAANGKAHLVPVTIMIDGKFYDASAYKADPVPMALQSETVYEGVRSGAPQGLFTVSGARQKKDAWVAEGKWETEAQIQADKDRQKAEAAKKAQKAPKEDVGGPPKLKRAPQASENPSSSPQSDKSAPSTPPPPSTSNKPSSPNTDNTSSSSKQENTNTSSDESQVFVNAPDRPILRRQPASESSHEQVKPDADLTPLQGPIQFIPAVSDAGGPEARPYTYEFKPEEEQNFLKKMLALATNEVQARAKRLSAESTINPKPSTKNSPDGSAPELQNVQFRYFDLINSNEPVLVLSATATIPNARKDLNYIVTLVAREDIYGELHKVFARTTDNQHLDVLPKYDFIDAVDADGDGRGELLFRTTSDSGSAFSLYAVIGDRLWPLFEGKPGA